MSNKTFLLTCFCFLFSQTALAAPLQINVGTNSYDEAFPTFYQDPDTHTGTFSGFGFSDILATSLYDFSNGSIVGKFIDTNIESKLTALGIPATGPSLDGSKTVSLVSPDCPSQCDLDALNGLAPPLNTTDDEGFLNFWALHVEYSLEGILDLTTGPTYTNGFINISFIDLVDPTKTVEDVLTLSVTGSSILGPNLAIFFEITAADEDFLYSQSPSGQFLDVFDGTLNGNTPITATMNTNVVPPIPLPEQLLLLGNCDSAVEFSCSAVRQSSLSGSIIVDSAPVPEPTSIALISLALLGLGIRRSIAVNINT